MTVPPCRGTVGITGITCVAGLIQQRRLFQHYFEPRRLLVLSVQQLTSLNTQANTEKTREIFGSVMHKIVITPVSI